MALAPIYSVPRFRSVYLIALSATALLAIAAQILIHTFSAGMGMDAATINAAGRQRMLGQQVAMAGYRLAAATGAGDADAGARAAAQLRGALQALTSGHASLRGRPDHTPLHGLNSPDVMVHFDALEEPYLQLTRAARELLRAAAAAPSGAGIEVADAAADLEEATAGFLVRMTALADTYARESAARLDRLRTFEAAFIVATLVVLILEALFLFEPAVRRLRRQHEEATARSRALEELTERYDVTVAGASNGLWDWRVTTGEVWYSKRFWLLLGHPEEGPFPPHTIESFQSRLHPDDEAPTLEAVRRHLEDGAEYDVEYRLRAANGEYRWMRARGASRRDANGKPIRMSGSIEDIENQRRTEQRLTLAMRASKIGLWDWDVPSGNTFFSDSFYTMLGYEPGELPMSLDTWTSLSHPDDLPDALADVQRHLEGATPIYENEHRLRKKDGSWMWIRDVGEVVDRDENGAAQRMIGVHIDIDASKRLDLALRSVDALIACETEAETFFRLGQVMAEQSGAALVGVARRIERDGVASACMVGGWHNGAAIIPFEYELEGTPCAVGLDERDLCLWESSVLESFPDDHTLEEMGAEGYGSIRLRDSQGVGSGLLIMIHTKPIRDPKRMETVLRLFGPRAAAELERIEHQARLRAAKDAAEAANDAKSEFLANMSHEIRTPMTAILGYAELIGAEGNRDPAQCAEYAGTIRRNGEHLLAIINDVLDISKIEAGRLEVESIDTSPADIVHEVIGLMGVKAEAKSIRLDAEFETPVPTCIQTDPVRLRQILMNLIGNAIKFTEIGGVTVRVAYEPRADRMYFRVVDSGIGMADEHIPRLFRSFSQADSTMNRRFGGTGLGLRISKSLAEILGGDITVESTLRAGSTFTLTVHAGVEDDVALIAPECLPERRPVITPEATETGRAMCALDDLRILLAEDGIDNQRLLSFHLGRAGAIVTIVQNGRLAVEALTVDGTVHGALLDPAPFDVLITDMQMPEMDGYEAVRFLRERGSSIPIVALTAHAMDGDRERCLAAGCDAYATKPIEASRLLSVCAATARRRAA